MRNVFSMKLSGMEGIPVNVEVSMQDSYGGIHLVGLADTAVKESFLRVVTALNASGFAIPLRKIIINLAPADLRKSGSGYDLPIALGIIAESNQSAGLNDLEKWLVLGELGLDGSVREVPGCVQAVRMALDSDYGYKGVIIPKANGPEVSRLFANLIPVYGVNRLREAIRVIDNPSGVKTVWEEHLDSPVEHCERESVFGSLSNGIKRALEIAAAGGHHVLIIGPLGSGRTMFARALVEILPRMSMNDIIDVAAVYSAAGRGLYRVATGQECRPLRAPYISASIAAMLGGGIGEMPSPGEVSLTHNGVLYMDEFNAIPKSLGLSLKNVMLEKKVVISRLKSKVTYPADFQFVGSLDSCPCGHYGDGIDGHCQCTPKQRQAWMGLIGQSPVYPMIDVHVWAHNAVPSQEGADDAEQVAERVANARLMQNRRYADEPGIRLNRDLNAADTDSYCHLDDDCYNLLQTIIERLGLSSTSLLHILRVARTIADLEMSEEIKREHIAEAASWRFLDKEPATL